MMIGKNFGIPRQLFAGVMCDFGGHFQRSSFLCLSFMITLRFIINKANVGSVGPRVQCYTTGLALRCWRFRLVSQFTLFYLRLWLGLSFRTSQLSIRSPICFASATSLIKVCDVKIHRRVHISLSGICLRYSSTKHNLLKYRVFSRDNGHVTAFIKR